MKKELLNEKWSSKYKKTINCKNPRGFSQKAHCNSKINKENKMKNENNFKQRISEMAANIAEAEVEVGDPRVKIKTGKGIKSVEFKSFKPTSQESADAIKIVYKMSMDAQDFPTRAVVGKMFVNNDAKQGEMLVFRIDFETIPSFVAIAKTNPSDLLPTSSVNVNMDKLAVGNYDVSIKMKGSEAEDREMDITQIKDLVSNFKFKKDIKQPLKAGNGTLTLKSTEPIKNEKKEKKKFLKKNLAYQSPATRRSFSTVNTYKYDKLSPTKSYTKVSRSSQSPAFIRSVNEEEEQSFKNIKKRKSAPIVTVGFLGKYDSKNPTFDKGQKSFSNFKNINDIEWLEYSTKDLISSFFRTLRINNIKEIDTENLKNMKNEKNFKQKISEMAARIAGSLKEDYEAEKINLPPAFLTKVNSSIVTSKNMAQFLLDIIDEVSVGEPAFKKIESMTGFNTVIAALKRLSGITPGKEEVPEVPSTNIKDMELPQLKESFNRINRK